MESRASSHVPDRISYLLSLQSPTGDEKEELLEWLADCSDEQYEGYLGVERDVESGESVMQDDDLEY